MAKGLFITGTGTDVGKTFVTGLLVKRVEELTQSAAYYKAAMSGNERDGQGKLIPKDAVYVKKISNIGQSLDSMCPFVYEAAVSPHLASRMEGNPVTMDKVMEGYRKLQGSYDYITVEGSGGILCPICFDESEIWLEDLIKRMDIPALIVADAGLGTINSLVLTYEYMKEKNIECRGIIFNHWIPDNLMHRDNLAMCQYRTGLRVLACVEKDTKDLMIDDKTLLSLYKQEVGR